MPYISVIPPEAAEGDLKRLYDKYAAATGEAMPSVLRLLGLHPDALRAVSRMSAAISYGGSTLGRRREEMLSTFVSALNHCSYWVVHHGELLREVSGDDALVYHLQRDHRQAALDDGDRAMLAFAARLNAEPAAVDAAAVEALRAAGFDDRAVLDIVLLVAMFNFMNRLASGLGLPADAESLHAREDAEARVEPHQRRET